MTRANFAKARNCNRHAFNLIELVVVVALIVGIWLGMKFLAPAFGKTGATDVRVWITTESGQSIKLGNVPIFIYAENDFREVVTINNTYAEHEAARNNQLLEADQKLIKAAAVYDATQLELAKRAMRRDVAAYNEIRNHVMHRLVFNGVNNGEGQPTTRTDSEGRATVTFADKNATYYVVAATERTEGDTTQLDCWLERIQPAETHKLQLSNFNLFDIPTKGEAFGFKVLPELPAYPWL